MLIKFNHEIQHGDSVIIRGDPFDGFKAIYDQHLEGSECVRFLLDFLHGLQTRIKVSEKMIKPIK